MGWVKRAATYRIHLRFLAVVLCGLVPTVPLMSQLITSDISQYSHKSWLAQDGAVVGNTQSITQTKDGNLWIGSAFGLQRFDGINFTFASPVGGSGLAKAEIASVLGAQDGSLWIGTAGGLFHLSGGRVTSASELAGTIVETILEDHAGNIWAGGARRGQGNRLCRIGIESNSTKCFGDSTTFGIRVIRLFEDKLRTIWITSDTGLWKCDEGRPEQLVNVGAKPGAYLSINSEDVLVEVDKKEARIFLPASDSQGPRPFLSVSDLANSSFVTDRQGGLWIGTQGKGLVHSLHGKIDTYAITDGLSSDIVYRVYQDSEENIWVVTDTGVDRFRRTAIRTMKKKQGLSSGTVTATLSDGRSIWVATDQGLDRISDHNITVLTTRDGLPSDDTNSLFQVTPDKLFITTSHIDGLVSLENGHITRRHTPSGESTYVMTSDGAGGIWMSDRQSGLVHVPDGNGYVEQILWSRFGNKPAQAMVFDPLKKGLWLAFQHGDLEFFRDGQVLERYSHPDAQFTSPRDLQLDAEGTVWFGSQAGYTRLRNGKLATLSSRNGLPCSGVFWRKDDEQHSTWLETPCGIVRLPPGELDRWSRNPDSQIRVTTYLDNFDGADIAFYGGHYSPVVIITPDGRLAYQTYSGLAIIDPHEDFTNHQAPPVHIEDIEADANKYSLETAISLPPRTHVVRVGYSALSFRVPQKVRYRYKLEGYDKHWSEILSSREATYTNLPPGKYHFHVIACNDSGVWNEAGDTLALTVRPAFYQTVWFLSICIAVAGLLMWIAYRSRVRYVCQQVSDRIEAQTTERLNLSRDLHDTILQSVQGLLLSFHALSEDPTVDGKLRTRIVALGDRAEQVIGEGREKIKSLRFEKHSERSFTEEIAGIADALRPEGMPVFNLSVTGEEQDLIPLVYEEMCFICREALTNAFRHAGAHEVEVLVSFSRTRFGVIVRDDGRGFEPDSIGHRSPDGHWGIVGMKERAARLGVELKIRSSFPERTQPGTSVIIDIPASVAYASTNF